MEESQGSTQQNLTFPLLMMLKVFSNSSSPETDGINIGIRADDEEIDPNGSVIPHALEVLALNFSNRFQTLML